MPHSRIGRWARRNRKINGTKTAHTTQMRYVEDFDVTDLRRWLVAASFKAVIARFKAR